MNEMDRRFDFVSVLPTGARSSTKASTAFLFEVRFSQSGWVDHREPNN